MKYKPVLFAYIILLLSLVVYSYGFVDFNFPWSPPSFLRDLIRQQARMSAFLYLLIVLGLFSGYFYFLYLAVKKRLMKKDAWLIVLLSAIVLLFSWPAFSYDIFNYLAMAKVGFVYRENPYIIMPIEFTGEPLLEFMHQANTTSVYGPLWLLLSGIIYVLPISHLILEMFSLKLVITIFYLGCCWLIFRLSKQRVFSLVFFGLNPLVLIESLVSAHNDVVMLFFALVWLYFLGAGKKVKSAIFLAASFLVKFTTLVLGVLYFWPGKIKKKKRNLIAFYLLFA